MTDKKVPTRKRGHCILQNFLKLFIKKPKFVYLDKEIKGPAIILSNHVGKTGPLTLDVYLKTPFRFWGTHEMNDGLKSIYKYQSEVFYHQKQHWNLFLARAFCCIAAPLTSLYYKGLNLISTYQDVRFKNTLKQSKQAVDNGHSIIIFPEDSSQGYKDVMPGFLAGFMVLAKTCYKNGIDLPIYVSYLKKKPREWIVSEPVYYSQIMQLDRDDVAQMLCEKANSLQYYTKKD